MKSLEYLQYRGTVMHGHKYGRVLGFPTINLDRRQWVRQSLAIPLGIYGGVATLPSGKRHKAGIVIGPIDTKGLPKVEAHLIGYKGDLYGKRVTLDVRKFIRSFKPYTSEASLKQQIQKDINKINSVITL